MMLLFVSLFYQTSIIKITMAFEMQTFLVLWIPHIYICYLAAQSTKSSAAFEDELERLKILTANGTDLYFEGIENRTSDIRNQSFIPNLFSTSAQSTNSSASFENELERLKILTTNGSDLYFERIENRTRALRNQKFVQMLSSRIGSDWLTADKNDENFFSETPPQIFLGSQVVRTLKKWLLEGYDPGIHPPVRRILVNIDIYLQAVLDIDSNAQRVEYMIWVRQSWDDSRLSWDHLSIGLSSVRLPSDAIWIPNLVISNSLSVEVVGPQTTQVTSGGTVTLAYPLRVSSSCQCNTEAFPRDSHECSLVFMSALYTEAEMMISTSQLKIHDSEFIQNAEFTIRDSYIQHKTQKPYPTSAEHTVVIYVIKFARNAKHFQWLVSFPSFLISFIAILGLFTPTSSNIVRRERVSFGSMFMVAMVMLLVLIPVYSHPGGRGVPRIGIFIIFQLFLLTIATVCSVLILLVERRALYNVPIPKSVRAFVADKRVIKENKPVQPALMSDIRNQLRHRAGELIFQPKQLNDSANCGHFHSNSKRDPLELEMSYDSHFHPDHDMEPNELRDDYQYRSFKRNKLAFLIKNLVTEIRALCASLEAQASQQAHAPGDWQRVASRLDLICFVTFTGVLVLGTLFCLLL